VAELDYAFLADFATVDPSGKLTAVGASYTHLFVGGFPGQHLVSVAGRIRAKVGEQPKLLVRMTSPNETVRIDHEMQLAPGPDARPYGPKLDTLGLQFALTVVMPLPSPGLYEITLTLDDEPVRLLAFTAEQPS
jgi:Family of unknown function (DUF6941)